VIRGKHAAAGALPETCGRTGPLLPTGGDHGGGPVETLHLPWQLRRSSQGGASSCCHLLLTMPSPRRARRRWIVIFDDGWADTLCTAPLIAQAKDVPIRQFPWHVVGPPSRSLEWASASVTEVRVQDQ
jgi:hypothetical protein